MQKDFKKWLQDLPEKNTEAYWQEQTQDFVDEFADAGIETFPDLLRVIADKRYSPELRSTCCSLAGDWGDKAAGDVLIDVLCDPDDDQRLWFYASKSLIALEYRNAVPAAIDVMLNAPHEEMRYWATYLLTWTWDKRAVEALLEVLLDSREAHRIRGQAAEALAELKVQEAIDPMIELLEIDSKILRWDLVFSLGALRAVKALPALRWVAAEDDGVDFDGIRNVRREAEEAIESIMEHHNLSE